MAEDEPHISKDTDSASDSPSEDGLSEECFIAIKALSAYFRVHLDSKHIEI